MDDLIILFGEILPKAFVKERSRSSPSRRRPPGLARHPLPPLHLVHPRTLAPHPALDLGTVRQTSPASPTTNSLSIVDSMNGQGASSQSERELIENAINFIELEVWEIQTPRVDLFALNVRVPLENVREPPRQEPLLPRPRLRGTGGTTSSASSTKRTSFPAGARERPFELKASSPAPPNRRQRQLSWTPSASSRIAEPHGRRPRRVTAERRASSPWRTILEESWANIYDETTTSRSTSPRSRKNVFLVNAEAYLGGAFRQIIHQPLPRKPNRAPSGLAPGAVHHPSRGGRLRPLGDLTFQIVKVAGQRIQKIRIIRGKTERRGGRGREPSVSADRRETGSPRRDSAGRDLPIRGLTGDVKLGIMVS